MNRKIKHIFLACAMLQACVLFSQGVVTDNEMDKKYTPNESSIFNNLLKKNNDNSRSSSPEITIANTVKFCPTALFRQKALFIYERKIIDGLSISAGLGKAFGDDIFQSSATVLGISTIETHDFELDAEEIFSGSEYAGSGPLLFAGLKLYYSGTCFDGGFMEFTYRRETMDYELNAIVENYKVDGLNLASFKMNAFTFGYGFSGVSGKNNNITHEFFMNIGIKMMTYTRFEKVHLGGSTNNPSDFAYRRTDDVLTYRIMPSFNIGYTFGFGF